MGRTVPSFRMLLEEIVMELSVFKRALRGEEKIAFDSLMKRQMTMHTPSLKHRPLTQWLLIVNLIEFRCLESLIYGVSRFHF
jgi:hypothetical protein